MAKEEVLKSVDLKVSVNCCEGCKRKVLKALSIKGILKTEIHPSLPRITVTGNIEVHTLIKKLAKIGKTAELLPMEGPKPEKIHKSKSSDKETHNGSEEVKTDEGNFTDKSSSKRSNYTDNDRSSKTNSTANGNDNNKGGDKSTKDIIGHSSETYAPHATMMTDVPQMNCVVNPLMLQNQATLMAPQARVYYPMEGYAIPMPYYTVNNACSATSPCCIRVRDRCNCELPLVYHPPPTQSRDTGLADYFNDDNTAGCRVM